MQAVFTPPARTDVDRIRVIDSHTCGEPTRVIVDGGPQPRGETPAARRLDFAERFDHIRSAVVNEPRGSDVWVGALLCPPIDPGCVASVVFFNNVGCLGMCGHATIGVVVTLGHLGRIAAGEHRLETPVGVVDVAYDGRNEVAFRNVACYRLRKNVELEVPGLGPVTGDVAWGGNWFFLTTAGDELLERRNVPRLIDISSRIREALRHQGITGAEGAEIDHIELIGPPHSPEADARNFVLCPGGAYDRSPCGTGTSAKLACLATEDKLDAGRRWRQEGILGTCFSGWLEKEGDRLRPWIQGSAHVNAESTLLLDPGDPFVHGINP